METHSALLFSAGTLDPNDLHSVRSRLNEQSDLIMLLKETTDRQLLQCREYELRIAQEDDHVFDLQQTIEELHNRLSNEQTRSANLSQKVDHLFGELHKKLPDRCDGEVQCTLNWKTPVLDRGVSTDRDWVEKMDEYTTLKKQIVDLKTFAREKAQENDSLQTQLNDQNQCHLTAVENLRNELESAENECTQQTLLVDQMRKESIESSRKWRDEKATFERDLQQKNVERKKLQTSMVRLTENVRLLEEELRTLKDLRCKEKDELDANKQIQKLKWKFSQALEANERIESEFNAYKEHAKMLLSAEKKINHDLRRAFH